MAAAVTPEHTDILSSAETQAMHLAEIAYGQLAIDAARQFAEVVVLETEERDRFLGEVANRLESLDFDERRQVAVGFKLLVGATATSASAELALVQKASTESPTDSPGKESADSTENPEDAAEIAAQPLTGPQRLLLSRLVDDETIEQVTALPTHLRVEFASRIADAYFALRIPRVTARGKRQHAQDFMAVLAGKTYAELAKESHRDIKNVHAAVAVMAKGVGSRMSQEEIAKLVPKVKPVDTEKQAAKARKLQQTVSKKIFGEELTEAIADFTSAQRVYIAERLVSYLRSYFIRKDGPVKTQRRAVEIEQLFAGATIEDIAATVALPVQSVKQELHSSAGSLARRTLPNDKRRLIEQAKLVEAPTSS